MRNELPSRPYINESGIVNLDSSSGPGTHWVAYVKHGPKVLYYDSFGDLQPPLEFERYMREYLIKYNHHRFQKPATVNCGHLCLQFLRANA